MFVLDQTKNDRHLKFGAHSPMSISKNAIFQNSHNANRECLFYLVSYMPMVMDLICSCNISWPNKK